jgi:2-oxoisovalerate dehydrogenase E1 component
LDVGISRPYSVLGSITRSNEELVANFPGRTSEDIFQRTGIQSRHSITADETSLTFAVAAAKKALAGEGLEVDQIDGIICTTGAFVTITPSLACHLHHQLARGEPRSPIPCYDLLAACSGYVYALCAAYDSIRARPDTKVLIVTAEVGSGAIDPADFDTAILFGDAATATVVYGSKWRHQMKAILRRPVISARGDDGSTLCLPLPGRGPVTMDGTKLAIDAVRSMAAVLGQACAEVGISMNDLDLIIPHQANGRIIRTLRAIMDLPPEKVLDCIRDVGNTSSSSLPLILSDVLRPELKKQRIGLCAFGGGVTFGAAVLETCC